MIKFWFTLNSRIGVICIPKSIAGSDQFRLYRFGRVVDQRWVTASGHTDRFQYTYDRNSNPLSKNIVGMGSTADNFDETFTYDSLNQLSTYDRANGFDQDWNSFDGQGNWLSFNDDGTTQTRTANQQNEIASISGATTPTYDANGNMTGDETGKTYEYDAWNRLVRVKDGSTTLISFEYDAQGWRIEQTADSETRDFFFSTGWQVLEEQVDGSADVQYVWSPVYVDAMIARDWDSDSNGSLETRHYVQQDANWNVTAIIDELGSVAERYVYTPFGEQTILTDAWESRSASLEFWVHGFQGKRFASLIGLNDFNNRSYSPVLGRFVTMDPISFASGYTDLYMFVGNRPTGTVDPSGLLETDNNLNMATMQLVDVGRILEDHVNRTINNARNLYPPGTPNAGAKISKEVYSKLGADKPGTGLAILGNSVAQTTEIEDWLKTNLSQARSEQFQHNFSQRLSGMFL